VSVDSVLVGISNTRNRFPRTCGVEQRAGVHASVRWRGGGGGAGRGGRVKRNESFCASANKTRIGFLTALEETGADAAGTTTWHATRVNPHRPSTATQGMPRVGKQRRKPPELSLKAGERDVVRAVKSGYGRW
jgi:hypothetical protein